MLNLSDTAPITELTSPSAIKFKSSNWKVHTSMMLLLSEYTYIIIEKMADFFKKYWYLY